MNCCNDTFTSSNGCYSTIKDYGANGKVQPIMNPYPATIMPKVYCCPYPSRIQQFNFYGSCFTQNNCC